MDIRAPPPASWPSVVVHLFQAIDVDQKQRERCAVTTRSAPFDLIYALLAAAISLSTAAGLSLALVGRLRGLLVAAVGVVE